MNEPLKVLIELLSEELESICNSEKNNKEKGQMLKDKLNELVSENEICFTENK